MTYLRMRNIYTLSVHNLPEIITNKLFVMFSFLFCRCLVVYPWCERYFGNFGNLYNAAAILANPMIAKHGTTILHGLDRAVKNMDNIKQEYAELSVLHSEKLHVDPDNFKVMGYGTVVTNVIYIQ